MDEEREPAIRPDSVRSTTRRFIKVSRRPDDDERIRREAALLQGVRHAGVVRFIAADTAAFPNVLITERVEGSSLAALGALPATEIDRVLHEVGATLEDLHQLGVVHGAVAPEHILVPPEGQPVLCSLGYGGRIGDPAPPLPPELARFAWPGRAQARLGPEVDLYALDAVRRSLPAAVPQAPRPRVPLVVGALSGAALLLAVGIWGLAGQNGSDRAGQRAAITTTFPPSSTNRDRSGTGPPRASLDTPQALGAAPADSPRGEAASPPNGPNGPNGVGRPVPRRPIAVFWSKVNRHGTGAAEGSGWAVTTHPELAHSSKPAGGSASVAGFPWGSPPGSTGRSSRVRATSETRPDGSAPADPPSSEPTPPPLPPTSPPLSLPDPGALSPHVSFPPPESLPADVTLPDPTTLAPPVSLPDESTLVPEDPLPETDGA